MVIKKTTTKKAPAKKAPAKKAPAKKALTGMVNVATPKAEMRKWEIESALSTLKRADEIRKDAKMMSDVKRLAQQQMNVLSSFTKK